MPYLVVALLVLNLTSVFPQASFLDSLLKKHEDFTTPTRENFHLHLNKTVFLEGERIWFKAYVFDQNLEKPSTETSNLFVGLYNSSGDELNKKLIYIENGTGRGDFKVDTSLPQGEYYVKAYTTWMQNFKNPNSYYQKIRVLGNSSRAELAKPLNSESFTLQLFPENGLLLENAQNTVGFKVSGPDGSGIAVDNARLVDEDGEMLLEGIKSNELGFGKFTFVPRQGRNYRFLVQLRNGAILKEQMPETAPRGVLLSVNTMQPQKLLLNLNTNTATLKKRWGEVYYIAFRKNETLIVEEFVLQDSTHSFNFEKARLPSGINILTLFDSRFNPVSERMFFNELGLEISAVSVSKTFKAKADSVEIDLHLLPGSVKDFSLSASVLPAVTMANRPNNSIQSAFWLMPYLKYPIEKPFYYLESLERKRLYALDLMLLTQGAGSYDWQTVFEHPPKTDYRWDTGIRISGKVLDADIQKENQLWMYPRDITQAFMTEIGDDKTFATETRLFKGDSLALSASDNKGKLRSPKVDIIFETADVIRDFNITDVKAISASYYYKPLSVPLKLSENTIALEEVDVTAEKPRNRFDIDAENEGRIVTDEDIIKRVTLENYLRKLGFRVAIESGNGVAARLAVRSKIPNKGGGHRILPIFVDGMWTDGSDVMTMPLSHVQSIVFDSFKSMYLSITLRKGDYAGLNAPKNNIKYLISEGYASPQEYDAPKYPLFDDTFEKYGAMAWKPELILNDHGATIQLPKMEQDNIKIFLEGMATDGTLISTVKTVNLN